jgi:hypothetical protein
MVLLFVIAFAAFATMACDDSGLDCSAGPSACVQPANIIMGDKSDIESAVGDLLAGDNPQNVLSGGKP